MAIRRACSYEATFGTKINPSTYSAILVTFSQDDQIIINKSIGDPGVTINSDSVVVTLSQEETLLFKAGETAFVQIRCYKSTYDAPGSRVWAVEVFKSLNEEVLS